MSLVMITSIFEDFNKLKSHHISFKFEFHFQGVGYFQGEDHGDGISYPRYHGGFEGMS